MRHSNCGTWAAQDYKVESLFEAEVELKLTDIKQSSSQLTAKSAEEIITTVEKFW